MCGGATPDESGSEIVVSLARMRARSRARSRQRDDHGRSRRDARRGPAGGRGRGSAVSAVARVRRKLHDRRQPVDERRRHCRAPLRQCARPRARRRGRARRRSRLGWPARLAQGQHRLRPEAALHRQRRDARHRHRGGAEALCRRAHARDRARRRCRTLRVRSTCCGRCKQALGDRLVGIRADQRRRAATRRASIIRTCPIRWPGIRGTCCCRRTTAPSTHRLLRRSKVRSRRRAEDGIVADATIAQSDDQAGAAVGAAREHQRGAASRRPEHQARHLAAGLRDSRISGRCRRRTCKRRSPARGSSSSAISATAICTTTLRRPRTRLRTQFLENTAAANRIVHDHVVAAGGSISAEHGIGQLKRDELAHYKAPLELELMRRIKTALDPRGVFNPGKVL